jgi:putative copper export protein
MMPILPLLQAAEDRITASGLAQEYAGFLSYFGIFGALGFRWLVLRRTAARQIAAARGDQAVGIALESVDIGAARVGIIGAIFMLLNLFTGIAAQSAEKGITFAAAWSANGARTTVSLVLALTFMVSFALALKKVRSGWVIAALAGVVYTLRNITSGKWTSLVNPLHEVAASLWLGTLFVLVVAGLPTILRGNVSSEQRGSIVADMVADFSPVAIGAALLLGITGVTTAWRHLKFVAALWTTPYGFALDMKLLVVAIVVSLGAWNWRRMRPRLGLEAAAHEIRKSARTELYFAALVLIITGVLVSLPSPRLPHP